MTKKLRLMMTMLLLAVMGSVWAGESEVYNFAFMQQSGPSGYANTYDVTIGGKSWTIPGNLTNGNYLRIGGKSITQVNRVIQCNEILPGNISKIVFNHNGKSRANITVHSVTVTVASDAEFSNIVDVVTVSNPTIEKSTEGSITFEPTSSWNGDLYYKFTVNISNSDSSNGGLDLTSLVFYETTAGAVDPVVSFANASETIEVGQTVTNTLTKPNDLTVTFSSDPAAIATVDENGEVTGVAVGEATITASWDAVTDKYNAGSVSYSVTVTATTPAVNFVKVTDANQLVAGNEYIIVGTKSGKTAAMGVRTGTNTYRNEVIVTETNNTVAVKESDGIAILTLGGSDGVWTFLASDNEEYLALTANSNALHSSTDATKATSQWTITNDFQVKDNSFNRYIQYNSGSTRFACYTSGQGTSYLYVKEGSSEIPSHEVTFSANGTTISTETVKEGESIVFPANPSDVGDYQFIGWSTDDWTGEVDERPATLVSSATMGTEDMTIYAVYAIVTEGSGERWKKVAASEVTEPGVYAIITHTQSDNAYYAFNGTITSGHGQTTPGSITFDQDGYSETMPTGTLELNFIVSGNGYVMKHPNETANGNKPYLCAGDAASGNLVWYNSGGDDYWSYSNENWTYSKDFSGKKALLRQYNNTIRTYGSNSGNVIEFAQKVGGITYSNYCTTVDKYEIIEFATDGYKTYVTENPIDWEATLERNNSDIDVHGYKAIAFSVADGVSLVEFGVENLSSVAETDPMYQEPITPAETPMIIMGKQGKNYLVISSETANAPKGNLFRKGDGVATTTLQDNGDIKEALYVMQKIDVNGSGIDNYKFYRLRPGYTVPEGKAYLSGNDITLPTNPSTPVVNNIKSSYPMRVLVQEDEQLVSEDAGIVDGIGMNYQEGKDNVYYNVNGMRIANPSKGIYIVNGRKVVLK